MGLVMAVSVFSYYNENECTFQGVSVQQQLDTKRTKYVKGPEKQV